MLSVPIFTNNRRVRAVLQMRRANFMHQHCMLSLATFGAMLPSQLANITLTFNTETQHCPGVHRLRSGHSAGVRSVMAALARYYSRQSNSNFLPNCIYLYIHDSCGHKFCSVTGIQFKWILPSDILTWVCNMEERHGEQGSIRADFWKRGTEI
jgi:hypothetical protein